MPLESDSDRSSYLADFGTAVTGDHSFKAIHDNEYVEFGEIQGRKPVLYAPYLTPVTSITMGDSLTVSGLNYTVIRIEDESTGWCMIVLERV